MGVVGAGGMRDTGAGKVARPAHRGSPYLASSISGTSGTMSHR